MWCATPEVELGFKRDFDEFGDSYTQPVTVEGLRSILERVKPKKVSVQNNIYGSYFSPGFPF